MSQSALAARPSWRVFAATVALATISSFTGATILALVLERYLKRCDIGFSELSFARALVEVVIIGPLLETFILAFLIRMTSSFLKRSNQSAVASALICSFLHGLICPAWGVVIFPSFLVFSIIYIKFVQFGFKWAFLGAFFAHAIQNFLVFLLA